MPTGLGDELLWLCPSLDDSPNDLSGNGNNGTYVNGISTVVDSDPTYGGSRAYNFDGTNDYIRVPKANFAFLVETNSFSQSVWVKTDGSTGQRTFIGGKIDGTKKGTALYQDTPGTFKAVRAKGSAGYSPNTASSTAVPASQWTHYAWALDNTTSTLYMDGVQIFQDTGTFVTTTGPLDDDILVGCYSSYSALYSFFSGLIDDVRIFDRAITQAEVTLLASTRGFTAGGVTHVNRTLLGVG